MRVFNYCTVLHDATFYFVATCDTMICMLLLCMSYIVCWLLMLLHISNRPNIRSISVPVLVFLPNCLYYFRSSKILDVNINYYYTFTCAAVRRR